MTPTECTRESDVIDAVASRRWPDRCGDELRHHVATCEVCADVADVAQALLEAGEAAAQEAQVPPAGQVWWRAELLARQEAARAAAQPITLVQAIAGVCAAGLAVTAIGLTWPWYRASLAGLREFLKTALASGVDVAPNSAWTLAFGVPLLVALGVWLVLMPVAVYLVLSDE